MGVQIHRLSRVFTLYLCCTTSQDRKRMEEHNRVKGEGDVDDEGEVPEAQGVWAEWLGSAL